jgi:hypothetical protein
MNRLSAIDAFGPAFTRVGAMLFRPFRIVVWLKLGFIGLLGGGLIVAGGGGGGNFRGPVIPPNAPHGDIPPELEDVYRAIRSIHLADYAHLFVIIIGIIIVLALIFLYLFCRFRFVLFDAVVTGQPSIGRGWRKYASQANRYFGFWLAFRMVEWGVVFLIVGMPLLRAYKNGVFNGDNSLPVFLELFGSIALGAIAASIVFAVVSTLAKDFVMPVLALDDFALGDAWSAVWRVVASEPGAWAAYLGLKLLCAIGASIFFFIAFFVAMLPATLLIGIPTAVLVVIGVLVFKAAGAVAGIIVFCLAGLVAAAGLFCVVLILTAPIAVFFASYAFYFFGGRYPKLAALLWPQPVPPPPVPQMAGTQPTAQLP